LTWTAPANDNGSPVTSYELKQDGVSVKNANVLTHTISGLTAGTVYSFTVDATNAYGSSVEKTYSWTASFAPEKPTGLQAQAGTLSYTSLTIEWTAPSNGGSPITGYKIEHKQSGVTSSKTVSASTTSQAYTGLTHSTAQDFTVQAVNANGDSAGASVTLTTLTPTAPGTPQTLTRSATTRTTITLSWTAPTSNGGSPITSYELF
jgi:hypothetical protein